MSEPWKLKGGSWEDGGYSKEADKYGGGDSPKQGVYGNHMIKLITLYTNLKRKQIDKISGERHMSLWLHRLTIPKANFDCQILIFDFQILIPK